MIRYMTLIRGDREFDTMVKYELESPLWYLDKKIPELPHIKLKIKIVGKEKRYAHRGRRRRFLIFRNKEEG